MKKLELIPIREFEVMGDEMLALITAGDDPRPPRPTDPSKPCPINECDENTVACGINKCNLNAADCSSNTCGTNRPPLG